MRFPDFLVIGSMRAGTTWLYQQLCKHPDIYLPTVRKEIHYFDRFFERGDDWYASFFENANHSKVCGEITPKYLFDPTVPDRIKNLIPNCKLIVILRNPVDRAFSQYIKSIRDFAENRSFRDYISGGSDAFQRGLYAEQLVRYMELFDPSQILIVRFENMMKDKIGILNSIFDFLDVSELEVSKDSLNTKRNAAAKARWPALSKFASKTMNYLVENDMDYIVTIGKKMGLQNLLRSSSELPKLDLEDRKWLLEKYLKPNSELETLLRVDFGEWQKYDY